MHFNYLHIYLITLRYNINIVSTNVNGCFILF